GGRFGRLNVNAVRRARYRAQEAPHALLQPVFVAMQHMNAAVPRLEMHRLVRIVLRHGLPEHILEGDAESLGERAKSFRYFTNGRCHSKSLTNAFRSRKFRSFRRFLRPRGLKPARSASRGSARFR